MRTGNNVHQRKDGRFEARYIKARDKNGQIQYGYCYGQTYEEAEQKRSKIVYKPPIIKELNLLILGAGSYGEEVLELVQSLRLFRKISFLDDDISKTNTLGMCDDSGRFSDEYTVAIPAVGNNTLRAKWMQRLINEGFIIPKLIHPAAVVSSNATIGIGTVVCAGATIGAGAVIGMGSIISSGSTIDRYAVVKDWTLIDCGEVVSSHGLRR